jgi:hypothetical protein
MSLIDNSISLEQVEGDVLHIRYVPLSAFDLDVQLWEENSKLHDLQLLEESILEYGYADCAKWDTNLNSGRGGFVYGNGRSEALIVKLNRMMLAGEEPPRGVGCNTATGEWVIPVKFGVDALSEAQAKAFNLSHNLLTMSGGDYSAGDIAKMFSSEFSRQLKEMADEGDALPVGFDGDYLDSLLRYEQLAADEPLEFDSGSSEGSERGEDSGDESWDAPPDSSTRMLQLFLSSETHPELMDMVEVLNKKHHTHNPTDCILSVMREAYQQEILPSG